MDPSTGTFTTMDTYQGTTDDPVSLHKYLYANSNPIKYNDPSGHVANLEEFDASMCIQEILESSAKNLVKTCIDIVRSFNAIQRDPSAQNFKMLLLQIGLDNLKNNFNAYCQTLAKALCAILYQANIKYFPNRVAWLFVILVIFFFIVGVVNFIRTYSESSDNRIWTDYDDNPLGYMGFACATTAMIYEALMMILGLLGELVFDFKIFC